MGTYHRLCYARLLESNLANGAPKCPLSCKLPTHGYLYNEWQGRYKLRVAAVGWRFKRGLAGGFKRGNFLITVRILGMAPIVGPRAPVETIG